MKKGFITFLLLFASLTIFAQNQARPQWNSVTSNNPETFKIQLVSSSESSIRVNVQVPGFFTTHVNTPMGEAEVISMPKAVNTLNTGDPDLPMIAIPAIIGDDAQMNVSVQSASYTDFEDIEVAPSKGDFPRSIDPASVPYTYGEAYQRNAFFPEVTVGLYEPYILRDFRGQNIVVYPFAYNPVTKTLRVYHDMTVIMYKEGQGGANIIENRRSNVVKIDPDFKNIYEKHFINYRQALNRYIPVDEEGCCHGPCP